MHVNKWSRNGELRAFGEDLARYRRQDLSAAAADPSGTTDDAENAVAVDDCRCFRASQISPSPGR
jgi:hypothetical protein